MLADICVLAIMVFFVYMGYRAGFMKSLVKIASYVIALVLSFSLYPIVSGALLKTSAFEALQKIIAENIKPSQDALGILGNYIDSGINTVSNSVAELVVNIVAFVIILVASKILIRLIANVLGIFTKLPVIKQFNRLGGGVLGGLIGILVLYIACAVLVLFAPLNEESTFLKEINTSVFASEIYENNVVLNLLGKGK